MTGNIIPFGKYKGQPIEAVAEDRAYVEWLTAQPWFQQRYGNLYQIVINNFCEPSETPEHNEMQARFLDPAFIAGVAMRATTICQLYDERQFADWVFRDYLHAMNQSVSCFKFDKDNELIELAVEGESNQLALLVPSRSRLPVSVVPLIVKGLRTSNPLFEHQGCDVYVQAGNNFDTVSLSVEIKPQVGDDYPAILRQMNRSKSNILLLRSYHGTGVDQETFARFFTSQKISVVFESDVSTEIPSEKIFDAAKIAKLVSEKFISASYRVSCPALAMQMQPTGDIATSIDDLL